MSKFFSLDICKKVIVIIRFLVNTLITKVFSVILFFIFYIYELKPIFLEDVEFNSSFIELLNVFVFSPNEHFTVYMFFGVFLIMGMFFNYVFFIDRKVMHSFMVNRFFIKVYKTDENKF
ncbi:MAG: hypothetical protein U9Q33_08440 [Campylobacterota bacterium]|nr:hypothetical protein [Campylobacterota bacterium]